MSHGQNSASGYSTVETMNEADARPGDMDTFLDIRIRVRRKLSARPISQVPLSSCCDLAQPMPCNVVEGGVTGIAWARAGA